MNINHSELRRLLDLARASTSGPLNHFMSFTYPDKYTKEAAVRDSIEDVAGGLAMLEKVVRILVEEHAAEQREELLKRVHSLHVND